MPTTSDLTGNDNFYENFEVGAVYKHARGKTVTQNEAVTICHLVMNTASGHFDDHMMATAHAAGRIHVGESIVYGGVTIAIVIGLAYQDTGEQVIRETSMDNIRLFRPVLHGSTLYSYTEILAKEVVDEGAGSITFRHYGVDQNDELVFQGDRSALVRRKQAEY
jgi:acyl dehydratase